MAPLRLLEARRPGGVTATRAPVANTEAAEAGRARGPRPICSHVRLTPRELGWERRCESRARRNASCSSRTIPTINQCRNGSSSVTDFEPARDPCDVDLQRRRFRHLTTSRRTSFSLATAVKENAPPRKEAADGLAAGPTEPPMPPRALAS